jgi:hypothetical protein
VHFGVGSGLRRNRRRTFEALPTPELTPGSARSRSSRPDLVEALQVRPPQAMRFPSSRSARRPVWPLPDTPSSSLDDAQGKPGRAAAVNQRGDLMPVDVCCNSFGQRRRYSQPRELCYAPLMHERTVADDLMRRDRLHLLHLHYVKTAADCHLVEISQAPSRLAA